MIYVDVCWRILFIFFLINVNAVQNGELSSSSAKYTQTHNHLNKVKLMQIWSFINAFWLSSTLFSHKNIKQHFNDNHNCICIELYVAL